MFESHGSWGGTHHAVYINYTLPVPMLLLLSLLAYPSSSEVGSVWTAAVEVACPNVTRAVPEEVYKRPSPLWIQLTWSHAREKMPVQDTCQLFSKLIFVGCQVHLVLMEQSCTVSPVDRAVKLKRECGDFCGKVLVE